MCMGNRTVKGSITTKLCQIQLLTWNILSMSLYLFFSSSPQEVRLQYVSTPPGFSSLLA